MTEEEDTHITQTTGVCFFYERVLWQDAGLEGSEYKSQLETLRVPSAWNLYVFLTLVRVSLGSLVSSHSIKMHILGTLLLSYTKCF